MNWWKGEAAAAAVGKRAAAVEAAVGTAVAATVAATATAAGGVGGGENQGEESEEQAKDWDEDEGNVRIRIVQIKHKADRHPVKDHVRPSNVCQAEAIDHTAKP